jgi:hypothetical protein
VPHATPLQLSRAGYGLPLLSAYPNDSSPHSMQNCFGSAPEASWISNSTWDSQFPDPLLPPAALPPRPAPATLLPPEPAALTPPFEEPPAGLPAVTPVPPLVGFPRDASPSALPQPAVTIAITKAAIARSRFDNTCLLRICLMVQAGCAGLAHSAQSRIRGSGLGTENGSGSGLLHMPGQGNAARVPSVQSGASPSGPRWRAVARSLRR